MILFCATEAGGARELIPIILETFQRGLSIHVLSSPATTSIFSQENITSNERVLSSIEEAEKFLRTHHIQSFVFGAKAIIGTEHYLTAAAKKIGIRSLAVLDEWYHYRIRFQDENGHLEVYLPDTICLQDTLSRTRAMEEGLPANILHITGSPALMDLSKHAHVFLEHPTPVPNILEKEPRQISLLFLSEKLTVAYGKNPGERGTLGPYLGYQEDIVRHDLAEALGKLPKNILVIQRLHPTEQMKEAPPTEKNIKWKVETHHQPLWPLLVHAHTIIGMRSKALLEAAILGRIPISYQPNAFDPNICAAVRLGLATLCSSKDHLLETLRTMLNEPPRHLTPPTLSCTVPNAVTHILDLLLHTSPKPFL